MQPKTRIYRELGMQKYLYTPLCLGKYKETQVSTFGLMMSDVWLFISYYLILTILMSTCTDPRARSFGILAGPLLNTSYFILPPPVTCFLFLSESWTCKISWPSFDSLCTRPRPLLAWSFSCFSHNSMSWSRFDTQKITVHFLFLTWLASRKHYLRTLFARRVAAGPLWFVLGFKRGSFSME